MNPLVMFFGFLQLPATSTIHEAMASQTLSRTTCLLADRMTSDLADSITHLTPFYPMWCCPKTPAYRNRFLNPKCTFQATSSITSAHTLKTDDLPIDPRKSTAYSIANQNHNDVPAFLEASALLSIVHQDVLSMANTPISQP